MTWNKSNPKRCFIVLCCWFYYQITAICSPPRAKLLLLFLPSRQANFSLYYLQLVTIIIILAHNKQRRQSSCFSTEREEANGTDSNFLHRQFDTVSDNKFYSSLNQFFLSSLFYFAFWFCSTHESRAPLVLPSTRKTPDEAQITSEQTRELC